MAKLTWTGNPIGTTHFVKLYQVDAFGGYVNGEKFTFDSEVEARNFFTSAKECAFKILAHIRFTGFPCDDVEYLEQEVTGKRFWKNTTTGIHPNKISHGWKQVVEA